MDKKGLYEELVRDYKKNHRKSGEFFKKSQCLQIRGGSHNLRLFSPFPFYDSHCNGSKVVDIDGNTYIDFWQGHFANILGHNPSVVRKALMGYLEKGQGLETGFPGELQQKLARIILKRVKADRIRFTTSGTLSTMYAIMLAKSYTGRKKIMKIGGGWHGAQPFVLKGISLYRDGLDQIESAGLPDGIESNVLISRFNNSEDLEEKFRQYGEQVACLILEPFVGAGGFIFGDKEYIAKTRKITKEYGAILIFDEVVSGFRFHAGPVYSLYGVDPDLSTFGKAIGGGMPVSAVAGNEDIMRLCDPSVSSEKTVKFDGGTFSAHPASMLAGIAFLEYLIENEKKIYSQIGRLGEKARRSVEEIFSNYGFNVKCTGGLDSVAENSSIVGVHFLRKNIDRLASPEEAWDPEVNDFELRESLFKLAMLREGFNVFHGLGAISYAHTEEEIQSFLEATERIAESWQRYRN